MTGKKNKNKATIVGPRRVEGQPCFTVTWIWPPRKTVLAMSGDHDELLANPCNP